MSGTCGDSGGVDIFGKPCGAYPARHEQEIAGRCRHHGDADGEAYRRERSRGYAQRETVNHARAAFSAAHWAYVEARYRVARAMIATRPAIDDLAIKKGELEQARRRCSDLGVSTTVAPRNLAQEQQDRAAAASVTVPYEDTPQE